MNGANGKTNGKANETLAKANGAITARLLDVGVSNGQYGDRFYLNVDVNGRRARCFASSFSPAALIARAIWPVVPEETVTPGLRLDLPCRVITQQSADGRYLNVIQVLPLDYQKGGTA